MFHYINQQRILITNDIHKPWNTSSRNTCLLIQLYRNISLLTFRLMNAFCNRCQYGLPREALTLQKTSFQDQEL